ncbi:MAG TPA: thiol peroxidase [Cyclobacteriaceae bacterium]|nr:thiol peroxidase [Cyclobacteriaceae bacterium]
MAQTLFGEAVANTNGELPAVGSTAAEFVLTGSDMKDITSKQFAGNTIVLNIFPSVDTSTCATSVRTFNKKAAALSDTIVLCVSKDLPFALRRFCGAEGIDRVKLASDFRNQGFSKNYGVEFSDGPFAGLLARAIVVIDKQGKVKHTELVPKIGDEPNYDAALAAI